jgi:hypothetical protein
MKFILSFLAEESLKRPSIIHWILYGTNVYTKVNAMEDAQFNLIKSANDKTESWFDESNAEIGSWQMDDGVMTWHGVDAGSRLAWGS